MRTIILVWLPKYSSCMLSGQVSALLKTAYIRILRLISVNSSNTVFKELYEKDGLICINIVVEKVVMVRISRESTKSPGKESMCVTA